MKCSVNLKEFLALIKKPIALLDLKAALTKNLNTKLSLKNNRLAIMTCSNLCLGSFSLPVIAQVEGEINILATELATIVQKLSQVKLDEIQLSLENNCLVIQDNLLGKINSRLYYQGLSLPKIDFKKSALWQIEDQDSISKIIDLIKEINYDSTWTIAGNKGLINLNKRLETGISYFSFKSDLKMLKFESNLAESEIKYYFYLKQILYLKELSLAKKKSITKIVFLAKGLLVIAGDNKIFLHSQTKKLSSKPDLKQWFAHNSSLVKELVEVTVPGRGLTNAFNWHDQIELHKTIVLEFSDPNNFIYKPETPENKSRLEVLSQQQTEPLVKFNLAVAVIKDLNVYLANEIIYMTIYEVMIDTQKIKLIKFKYDQKEIMLYERIILT